MEVVQLVSIIIEATGAVGLAVAAFYLRRASKSTEEAVRIMEGTAGFWGKVLEAVTREDKA